MARAAMRRAGSALGAGLAVVLACAGQAAWAQPGGGATPALAAAATASAAAPGTAAGMSTPGTAAWQAEGLAWAPAPGSTLLSRRDLPVLLGQRLRGSTRTLVLALQEGPAAQVQSAALPVPGVEAGEEADTPEQAAPVPLAVVHSTRPALHTQVAVLLLPPTAGQGALQRLVVLEHLYGLVLRQDPEASYCLGGTDAGCDAQVQNLGHAELLRRLALARQAAAAEALRGSEGAGLRVVPWAVVTVAAAEAADGAAGVLLRLDTTGTTPQPLDGHTVVFARAPHAGCLATTRNGGTAQCTLQDTHGDGPHPGFENAPVLATFTGGTASGTLLLPTTAVLRPRP